MAVVNIALDSFDSQFTGAYSFSYPVGTIQAIIMLPVRDNIGVQLSFDSPGQASVEATLSTRQEINAGSALWITWSSGIVTGLTQSICHKAMAIRVNRVSGTPRLSISV